MRIGPAPHLDMYTAYQGVSTSSGKGVSSRQAPSQPGSEQLGQWRRRQRRRPGPAQCHRHYVVSLS